MTKRLKEGTTKTVLVAGALLLLAYGAISNMVQSYKSRAEEVLINLIRERQVIGIVHEEIPKLEIKSAFFQSGAYHSSENGHNKIILVNPPIFESPRNTLSHESAHAYVSERLRKLKPAWYERYRGMQFPGLNDDNLPISKRVALYWNYITKTKGLEELVAYQVVNEGIAMYFMLREGRYGYDGFTQSDDYRKNFSTEDCSKHIKNFPRDLGRVCATNLGQVLVTPLIDRYGARAIDAILLNLPTIQELNNQIGYQARIATILKL